MKNIVLIGFMGTGKTSVGRLLAQRLNCPFIDTDKKIELEANTTISEIFKNHGEQYFRELEQAMIAKVSRYTNTVIATGGGAVLHSENVERLKINGILIALTASLEVIWERTNRRQGTRPLLDNPNSKQIIATLLNERTKLYTVADFSINTDCYSPQQITDIIIDIMRKNCYLR